jgi:hypothetical protein
MVGKGRERTCENEVYLKIFVTGMSTLYDFLSIIVFPHATKYLEGN